MSKEVQSRLLLVILAMWVAGTFAVWLNASNNFRHAKSVFETAETSGLAKKLAPLPAEDARQVMRHLASEINRSIFRFWDSMQVALALAALGLAATLAVPMWRKVALGITLVLSLLIVFWITPTVLTLGPPLDFVPRDPPPPAYKTFMFYHSLYLIADGIKLILLCAVTAACVWRPGRAPMVEG